MQNFKCASISIDFWGLGLKTQYLWMKTVTAAMDTKYDNGIDDVGAITYKLNQKIRL